MAYDVFISFKRTDEQGNDTPDFSAAKMLNHALIDAGFSVFFSEEELRAKGDSEWVKAIEDALSQAAMFVLVVSERRYLDSGWVLKEWSSFVNLAAANKKKRIYTLLFNEMTEDQLPALLGSSQSFRLENGVDKVVSYLLNALHPETGRAGKRKELSVKELVSLGFGIGRPRDFESACARIKESGAEHPLLDAMLLKFNFDRGIDEEQTFELIEKLKKNESVAAAFCEAKIYRHGEFGKEISIPRFKNCLKEGKTFWKHTVKRSRAESGEGSKDLLLYVYRDDDRYLNEAEYMCSCIYELTEMFGVGCTIRTVRSEAPPDEADMENYSFVLYAASSLNAFDGHEEWETEWLDRLCRLSEDKAYLALAGIRLANVNKRFRNRRFILNDASGIGRFCSYVIEKTKGGNA